MSVHMAPDFKRGKTFEDTGTTVSSTNYNTDPEGKVVQLKNYSTTDEDTLVTKEPILARQVRNVSAVSLLPGFAVTWAAGYRGTRVDGYVDTDGGEIAGIVDPAYPTAGVPVGETFHCIVKGRVKCKPSASGTTADISEGDFVTAITAAASNTMTTAGRFTRMDAALSNNDNALFLNAWGRAATSANSTGTTDVLIDLDVRM